MVYDELHQRYGSHITKRVQTELTPTEFSEVEVETLLSFLEMRAEEAHREYQSQLSNPFTDPSAAGSLKGAQMDALYRRWREAEDLAYLISVAEDVSLHVGKSAS